MESMLLKKMIHFGIFGGPAKIHQMFSEEPPAASVSEELMVAGAATIAAVVFLYFMDTKGEKTL